MLLLLYVLTSNPNLYMEYYACRLLFVNLWMQASPRRRHAINITSKHEEVITDHRVEVELPDLHHIFFYCMSFGYVWSS
jgi:hypothetical protein